ncbi:MAG TPA: hypothetical protein VJQ54_02510 [Candidatus Sulfotelmatobacter sp.]|nr:hypothetical protein [Candidatus Sulfotelmatobacter sp.]
MTVALILVVTAALALVIILSITVSSSLQASRPNLAGNIQPLDIEAFRNLLDARENEYLHRRLPPADFRRVQRERLRAMAAYIQVAGQNATVLVRIGQSALAASDPQTVLAARQLIDQALLLRRNATLALLKIYIAMAWPNPGFAANPILRGYEQLSSSAMLLGRLQNPSTPVRISAGL